MASEWETANLGELCDFRAGSVFKPVLQGQSCGEFPFVKVSDMNLPANAVRIQVANNRVSETDLRELRAKPFPPGTVVFAKIGEALRQNRLRQVARETIVDNNMMGAVPRIDRIDPRFFYYALSQFDFSDIAQGTALPYLTVASLSALSLDVPPPDEQRAIAHILGTLDDKIELNRRMNETLEAMARALFKSWFVDFDPVRAKAEGRGPGLPKPLADLFPDSFEDSELGEIPKGWETIPLYETAKFINGAAFKSEDFCATGEGLPVVKIAELKDGISAQTKWSQRQAGPDQLIDTEELLYSWSGSPDTSLDAFLWTKGLGLLNQHIFKVVTPTTAQKRFVYYLLKYLRPILVETARNKQTTGLGHVTVADMKRLLVCWPTKVLRATFDQKIAPIFDRAFAITIEGHTLAGLREALLPKLISGELRVKDASRFSAEVA